MRDFLTLAARTGNRPQRSEDGLPKRAKRCAVGALLAGLSFSASAGEIVFPSSWILGYFVFGVICGLVIIAGFRQ